MDFKPQFNQQQHQTQSQSQKMAMTQALQQSIQILQYNNDDLLHYLEGKALENPLLEIEVMQGDYEQPYYTKNYETEDEANPFAQIEDKQLSLFEFLIEQIHLNYRETFLRQLIIFLVEYIDVNGYLAIDLEEAAEKMGATSIQMLDALTLLQQLDPPGVGARNLQECLMLQTERDDSAPELAYLVLEECFEEFANKKWQRIATDYQINLSEVQKIHDYVQTLTPNPGAGFGETFEQHIYPDLLVKIQDQELVVQSTRSGKPHLVFQKEYYQEISAVKDKEVTSYLKEKKTEVEWLTKSLEQRTTTILRVGMEIVKRQRNFFLDSKRPLQPLKLKEIAQELAVHESTISRAVNGKYLETDFGVFELRSFFTNAINTEAAESSSANDAQQLLKEIVAAEDKRKPLSDQKIVEMMKEKGIVLSRRTVAKYRDVLGILSSSNRKRYDE